METTPTQNQAEASANGDFRLFLQNEFVRRCRNNPRYSLRAFARTLQVDDSTLSKILNGKRVLGKQATRRLALKLNLGAEAVAEFTSPGGLAQSNSDANYQQLVLDSFQLIADWYHYAILELIRVDGFVPENKWVARALGLSVGEVQAAKERLVRLGLMEITAEGRWIDPSNELTTNMGPDIHASAHRLLQKQILEKAIYALETVPLDRRSQSAMTMAIDIERLPEAVEKIKKFRRGLAKFLSRGKKRTEVYNLSVSLYPVSTIHERK